jgi:hypothetical protein
MSGYGSTGITTVEVVDPRCVVYSVGSPDGREYGAAGLTTVEGAVSLILTAEWTSGGQLRPCGDPCAPARLHIDGVGAVGPVRWIFIVSHVPDGFAGAKSAAELADYLRAEVARERKILEDVTGCRR